MLQEQVGQDSTEQENKEQKSKEMTTSQVLWQIGKEGGPYIASRAVKIAIDATALSWLSKIDSNRQSAASTIGYMQIGLKGIPVMFLHFTHIAVRAVSNDSAAKKGNLLRKACLLALLLSAVVIPIAYTSQYTLPLLQQPVETADITQRFLYPYAAGLPFTFMTVAAQLTLLGLGNPNTVLFLTLVNEPLILVVGYPLMYGTSMLKETGLGIAYFVSAIMHWCCYLLLPVVKPTQYRKYRIFETTNFGERDGERDKEFWKLVKHGAPIGLYAMLELGSVVFSNMLIIQEGKDSATALLPAAQVGSYMSTFSFTLGVTLSLLERAAFKENRYADAKKITHVGAGICLVAPMIMLIVFLIAPDSLIQPFLGDAISESVDTQAKQFMLTVLLYEFADGLRNNFMCALWGLEETSYSTIANAKTALPINLSGALLTKFALPWGSAGILPSRAVGILANTVLIVRKWYNKIFQESQTRDLELKIPLNPYQESDEIPVSQSTAVHIEEPIAAQPSMTEWLKSLGGRLLGWKSSDSNSSVPSFSFENK